MIVLLLPLGRRLLHAILLLLLLLGLGLVDRSGVHERDGLLVLCNNVKLCFRKLNLLRQQVLSYFKFVNRLHEFRVEKVA